MKIYQLDPEEEEILKAFEEGKLVRVKNFDKEKKMLEEAARNTLNNINPREQLIGFASTVKQLAPAISLPVFSKVGFRKVQTITTAAIANKIISETVTTSLKPLFWFIIFY